MTRKTSSGRFVSFMRKAALPVCVGANVFIAAVAVFSGFAGYVDQETMPFAGIVGMTFPVWYVLCLLIIPVDLFSWRRLALVPVAALLIALKPWLTFFPLHFGTHEITPEEAERSFKVLSYNIVSFVDEQGLSTPEFNRTMHTVLASDADILVLLEFENQGPLDKFVPQSQIDSLNTIYPYFSSGKVGTVMFSKQPIVRISPRDNTPSRGSIEAFRTSVCGRAINIFGVHLESIGLDDSDKELYRDLTDKNIEESVNYGHVRTQLIDKLLDSFSNRARQAKAMSDYIEQLGGNTIVCGDFNDIPGCRTIRILEKIGMHDAYAETAFGACRTFNAPRFPFRIDHVLWRGDFRAVSIRRGYVASSDHYPMLTTFVWDK